MNFKKTVLISLIFCFLPITICYSQSLNEALNEAAAYFAEKGKIDVSKKLVVEVKNFFSKKRDKTAERIETELYFALEKVLPGITMV